MKSASLNSLATGPKIRVPLGVLSSLMITHALSSKRITEPFSRCTPYLVLTITALTTSPFFTVPPGAACFTVATTISPMLLVFLFEPPRFLITKTSLAPVLSATFNLLSFWIVVVTSFQTVLDNFCFLYDFY